MVAGIGQETGVKRLTANPSRTTGGSTGTLTDIDCRCCAAAVSAAEGAATAGRADTANKPATTIVVPTASWRRPRRRKPSPAPKRWLSAGALAAAVPDSSGVDERA